MECKKRNGNTKCAKTQGIETGKRNRINKIVKQKKKSIGAHMNYIVTTNIWIFVVDVCLHFHHIVAVLPTFFPLHILSLSLSLSRSLLLFLFLLFIHFHFEFFNPHTVRQRVHLTQRNIHTMQSNLCNQSPVPYSLILEMRSVWKWNKFFLSLPFSVAFYLHSLFLLLLAFHLWASSLVRIKSIVPLFQFSIFFRFNR